MGRHGRRPDPDSDAKRAFGDGDPGEYDKEWEDFPEHSGDSAGPRPARRPIQSQPRSPQDEIKCLTYPEEACVDAPGCAVPSILRAMKARGAKPGDEGDLSNLCPYKNVPRA